MRYFIELEYNGKNYHGWQCQPNVSTIQGEMNKCLTTLLKQNINIVGASRTDTGVNARKMFAHFDLDNKILTEDLLYKINNFLGEDIFVSRIFLVPDNMHARFSANSRTYKYYISTIKNPFNSECYIYYRDLDIDLMNQASNYLLNKKDFTSFSKLHTQTKNNYCNISKAIWEKEGNDIVFTIIADRFLRNMVRAIVGTLILVGERKALPNKIKHILSKKNRSLAGASVPAKGLFLTNISYPEI